MVSILYFYLELKKIYETKKCLFKPFFKIFLIFLFSICAIVRANYSYLDDLDRIVSGTRGWSGWDRYLAQQLSVILNTDSRMVDISPLPQVIAVAFLAATSVILISLFCRTKEISFKNIFAVLPVGISPYFLQCLSYKFDAPYMALSIFASIFPFLFINSLYRIYGIISVISVLIMYNTYQASSGIYILVALYLTFSRWNEGKNIEACFKFFVNSCIYFLLASIIYKLFFVTPRNIYVSNSIAPINEIIYISFSNIYSYVSFILSDFNIRWLILLILVIISFIYSFIRFSSRGLMQSGIAAIFLVFFGAIISYGAYIILEKPLFAPRAMYGIGVFIALMNLHIVNISKNCFTKIISFSLVWCFIVFAFMYGNALAEQKNYVDYRVGVFISDFSKLNIDHSNLVSMQIAGDMGVSPIVENLGRKYPIINRLIYKSVGGYYPWDVSNIYYHFGLKNIKVSKENLEKLELPIIVDNKYHMIRSDGTHIFVKFNKCE